MKHILFALLLALAAAVFAKDSLTRRPWFGAQLIPATAEQLAVPGQELQCGLVMPQVFPGSSAEAAGVAEGDILLKIDDMWMSDPSLISQAMKTKGIGAILKCELLRAGKIESLNVKVKEYPREKSDEFDVLYDVADIDGFKRRLILTKPKGDGPFPTIVLMGGLGCYSVDVPPSVPFVYRDILYDFTRNGYATVRIEKTGMGDSEGEPCAQQNFWDEVHGLKEGVKSLDRFKFLDRSKMIYLGHSMGGLTAPAVYQDIPCAGIVAIATSGIDWKEYELKNTRRQYELAGTPYDSIEIYMDQKYAAMQKLFVEHKTPDEILAEDSVFADHITYPAHYTFMQDVADLSIADFWKNVDSPTLFVCGTADFVVSEDEHLYAMNTVNFFHPGRAEYKAIQGMNHGFNNAGTQQNAVKGEFEPGIHPDFFPSVLEFCNRIVK